MLKPGLERASRAEAQVIGTVKSPALLRAKQNLRQQFKTLPTHIVQCVSPLQGSEFIGVIHLGLRSPGSLQPRLYHLWLSAPRHPPKHLHSIAGFIEKCGDK